MTGNMHFLMAFILFCFTFLICSTSYISRGLDAGDLQNSTDGKCRGYDGTYYDVGQSWLSKGETGCEQAICISWNSYKGWVFLGFKLCNDFDYIPKGCQRKFNSTMTFPDCCQEEIICS